MSNNELLFIIKTISEKNMTNIFTIFLLKKINFYFLFLTLKYNFKLINIIIICISF